MEKKKISVKNIKIKIYYKKKQMKTIKVIKIKFFCKKEQIFLLFKLT